MPTMMDIMKDVNKEAKSEILHIGLATYDYTRIPFTSPRLNYMSFGGLPVGKLVEFYGENGGGKTTTSLDIVANFQLLQEDEDCPKKVFWADCENTLDTVWAKKLGVNVDEMYILNPETQGSEDIFDIILSAIDTGEIGLVVIDSLGVMLSNQAMEKDISEKTYGGISMSLTTFSKKAEMLCQKHKCTLIGINQVRDDLGAMYAGAVTTPGGKAWKHNCAARFEFRKGKYIDADGNEIATSRAENPSGNIVQVTMVKNKTAPPTRRLGFYTLNYYTGIDYFKDLVDLAIKYEIINKSGAWFNIIDPETGEALSDKIQGLANVYKFLDLEEHADVLKRIEEIVNERMDDE